MTDRHMPSGLDGVLPLLACPHCAAALWRGGVVRWWSFAAAQTRMRPPGGVYLAALFSRLEKTWVRRTTSPRMTSGSPPIS